MAKGQAYDWPPVEEVQALYNKLGSRRKVAEHFGVSLGAVQHFCERNGIKSPRSRLNNEPVAGKLGEDDLAEALHAALKKRKGGERPTVGDLADELDVGPSRIREAAEQLRGRGFRVSLEEQEGHIGLERVPPTKTTITKSLLKGEDVRVGLVSDTHLCSNEEALEHLNLAYDHFAEEGITEVWHPGDVVTGVGIYKGQNSEISQHTYDAQVDYAEKHYPAREGIKTLAITGNHDIEGDFARIGANPVQALANRREDFDFIGDYSAWVELPNGAFAHLLHGKGGMSYAYSYKAQKLTEGYAAGRKPSILCPGHWHVHGWFQARGVQVVFPGCFEWRSKFMERLGLQPAVGFHILNIRLGDDGSIVRFAPEWFPFWEGRVSK